MQSRLGIPGECLARSPVHLTHYMLRYSGLPQALDGLRIAQLSDLHGIWYGGDNTPLLHLIEQAAPDLIAVTGDMMNSYRRVDCSSFLALARHLVSRWPVAFVVGNHEQRMEHRALQAFLETLREMGVWVLDNETRSFSHRGYSLALAGLWTHLRYYKRAYHPADRNIQLTAQTVRKLLGEPDPGSFTLLLTHNPLYFEAYAQWGAQLVLCGHVHGGLWEIPGVAGLLSPERAFFPRYSAGVYERQGTKMVVSRGLCPGSPMIRIHNPREVVLVTLRSGRDADRAMQHAL